MKDLVKQSYDLAYAILEDDPDTALAYLIIQVIGKLPNDKKEYSIEGVRECWNYYQSKARSEEWLRNHCKGYDMPDYDTLIESVSNNHNMYNEYLIIQGQDANGPIDPEMWKHLEKVIGKTFDNPPTSFSCSC